MVLFFTYSSTQIASMPEDSRSVLLLIQNDGQVDWSFTFYLLTTAYDYSRLTPTTLKDSTQYPGDSLDSYRLVPWLYVSPREAAALVRASHLHTRRSPFPLMLMLLSGDIELNPGPQRKWKYPCRVCSRPVMKNQKGVQCDNCDLWVHTRCAGITTAEYQSLQLSDPPWFCDVCCCATNLPFGNVSTLDSVFDNSNGSTNLNHDTTFPHSPSSLEAETNSVILCHLNAQSLSNKMDEVRAMLLKTAHPVSCSWYFRDVA